MNGKKGKKLTSEINSVRIDGKTGGTAAGYFGNLQPMRNFAGEVIKGNFEQDLFTFTLRDEHGEEKQYWADGGLRGALKMAKVQDGQCIFIEHTGTKKIDEGTVQTYEIFGYEFEGATMPPKKASNKNTEARAN